MNITNYIHAIAEAYGYEHQTQKAIEELAELVQALTKDDRVNIIEEIADVEIMIAQIKHFYVIGDKEIQEAKKGKISRQLERMSREVWK